jgi:hypothetical protein
MPSFSQQSHSSLFASTPLWNQELAVCLINCNRCSFTYKIMFLVYSTAFLFVLPVVHDRIWKAGSHDVGWANSVRYVFLCHRFLLKFSIKCSLYFWSAFAYLCYISTNFYAYQGTVHVLCTEIIFPEQISCYRTKNPLHCHKICDDGPVNHGKI